MNQSILPPIEEYLVQAIKTIRRKNTPSTIKPSQLWAVVESIGYTTQSYKTSVRWLLSINIIFCYGLSVSPREQRIMPAQVPNYNFQLDDYKNYRHIRLAILADGLTSEGKRALDQYSNNKGRKKAEEVISFMSER